MAEVAGRRTCPLCEAMCGLLIDFDGDRVTGVRGDPDDVFSRGYQCAKAAALADVHHDPDRLRRPLRRRGGDWEEVSWEAAISEAAERLASLQRLHGDDAVGLYQGNPTTHNYAATLSVLELARALGTRNLFSTASVDHLPHLFAAYQMFGNKALLPVPDIDRTDFLLVLGANPVVSNGSLMTAPDMPRRLRALRARGGRLVVVDPRRTQTARLADTHLAPRPGTDAWLLLALLHTVFADGLEAPGRLAAFTDGVDDVREAVRAFSPEAVADSTGLSAAAIRELARDFATAPTAACYGRLGVCTQPHGALSVWLMAVLNVVTGNLDRVGGMCFTTPAVDLPGLAALLGEQGSYDRWRSRVSGLPEFGGELPLAALAEEMATPGPGQIRGLVTVAGNPALSAPNGASVEAGLASLDFMVAVDFYINETTRHADLILPGPDALGRDHFDLLHNALAVRNVARYSPPLSSDPDSRDESEILLGIAQGLARRKGGARGRVGAARVAALRALRPRRLLALGLRFGPYGAGLNPLRRGLSLRQLERAGETIDLGPLEERRLPRRLRTRGRRIRLAPPVLRSALERLPREGPPPPAGPYDLLLIGRRQPRDNNSWMHNSARLMTGASRCRLLINSADATQRGISDGDAVRIRSRTGEVVAPALVSDSIRAGTVSLPHGYGHDRQGTRLEVAHAHPGVSVNDVTDDRLVDAVSGASVLNGLPVAVESAAPREPNPHAQPAGHPGEHPAGGT